MLMLEHNYVTEYNILEMENFMKTNLPRINQTKILYFVTFLFFVTDVGDTRNRQQAFPEQAIFNHIKAQKTLPDKNLVQASRVIYRICIRVRSIVQCSCRYFLC